MYTNLKEGEKLRLEKSANLMGRKAAIGGELLVTSSRVIFEPGSLDMDTGIISIPLENIMETSLVKILGFIPNGIELKLKTGEKYRFAVWNRKEILSLIENQNK